MRRLFLSRKARLLLTPVFLVVAIIVGVSLLGIQPGKSALEAAEPNIIVTTESALKQAVNAAPNSTAYVIELGADISLTSPLVIPMYKNITLTGDRRLTGAAGQVTISVSIAATLTIDGITVRHQPQAVSETGIYVGPIGRLNMLSGTISDNGSPDVGGGVYVDFGATFNMSGGVISGNAAFLGGGGVYNYGTFNFSGGKIANNTGLVGGGILNDGTLSISGGEISGNIAEDGFGFGGGVYNEGSVSMTGGVVKDNLAFGGGGFASLYGTLTISNGVICDNLALAGGGIFNYDVLNIRGGVISGNTGVLGGGGIFSLEKFTLSAGSISNNTALDGGGVYFTGTFVMVGGEISGNEATGDGGGVLLYEGTFEMTGGRISNNTAGVDGGGIWVDSTELGNLSIGGTAVFANNKASTAYGRNPGDNAIYASTISSSVTWTQPFTQGYNNYDISYTNGTQLFIVTFIRNYDQNDVNVFDSKLVPANTVIGSDMPANPTRSHYSFAGWNTRPDGSGVSYSAVLPIVTDSIVLYAQWIEDPKYTVTFQPGTQGTFSTQTIPNIYVNEPTPTPPAATGAPGWRFIGWSPSVSATVTGNMTYVAQWEQIILTVRVVDWDDTLIDTQTVVYGKDAVVPANPTREGYLFGGWDRAFTNITSDVTIKATYSRIILSVVFVDWNNNEISSQQVPYGDDAVAPDDPFRKGYTFVGWSEVFTNVKADTSVAALYKWNFPVVPFLIVLLIVAIVAMVAALLYLLLRKRKKSSKLMIR